VSRSASSSRDFALLSAGCSIPSTAQAYSLNFTAVPSGPLGFLSPWPTGSPYPVVSTLNSTEGSIIANAAIVPAGTAGGITVVAGDPTDLVIDINGYFAPPAASGLDFYPLTPCRIADTRAGQGKTGAFGPPRLAASSTRNFPIATSSCLSSTPQAYSLNITAVPQGPLCFLSTWPVGLAYHRHQWNLLCPGDGRAAVSCRDAVPRRRYANGRRFRGSLRTAQSGGVHDAQFSNSVKSMWNPGNRTGVRSEHDGCATRPTGFPIHVADGINLSWSLDVELVGRQHHSQRCNSACRNWRGDQHRCVESHGSDHRHRWLFRAINRVGSTKLAVPADFNVGTGAS